MAYFTLVILYISYLKNKSVVIIKVSWLVLTVTGLNYLNYSEAFIECPNDMDDIYKNIENYNPNKKLKILIVSDMIANMLSNKKAKSNSD